MSSLTILANRLKLLRDVMRNDGRVSAPFQTVMIEVTAICNLDCPICPARRTENLMVRETKQISEQDFRRIVDLTHDMTETYCLNMWGEPVLHRKFQEFIDYISARGRNIWFSTNLNYSGRIAEALSANPLLHIICSIDGWDEASYLDYRWGGRFELMRKNLAILAGGKCNVYPQYLLARDCPNPEEVKAKFSKFIADTTGTTDRIIFKTKLDNIRNDPGLPIPGRCSSMYAGLYFNSDGILMPCCTNVRKDVFLGHVSRFTREELRNGEAVRSLRRRILEDKDQFPSCVSCGGEDQQRMITDKLKERAKRPFARKRPIADPANRV